MNKNSFRQGWLLLGLLFVHFIVDAQEKETEAILTLLKNELSKAGVPVERPAIRLTLISEKEARKFSLEDKPADAFHVRATEHALQIVSRSADGLRNGAYWYLHGLGFRYYFPGTTWHYTPRLNTAFKVTEKTVSPAYTSRRIWYAYGTGSKQADAEYRQWFEANLQGGETVSAGHSYDGIVSRNKTIFLQHPEYFAQKVRKGEIPTNPKFEVSNEDLVQLVIRDAFAQIESTLKKTGQLPAMISIDPSDGGGFSTSPASLKIGGPSEQVFYLANRVAKAVRAKYPTVRVGLYAYFQHAAPPAFDLEPNIVVLIATAMNQSSYRTDELIAAWKKKGITLGIRDYFGVMAWDWDMPGRPSGGRVAYVKQLQEYYKQGIRLFSAETNIGWISRGLGHYIGARLLWDINSDIPAIKKEFFSQMFGRAAGDMEKLFDAWQQYSQPVPLDGDLYEWSRLLESASRTEKESKVQERIRQVKQYLHYVYLFKQWRANDSDENLVRLLNYAYRVQDKGVVASYPLFRRLANTAVNGKANMRFNDPKAVWKQKSTPVDAAETEQNFNADLRSLNTTEKTIVATLPRKLGTGKALTEPTQSSKASLPVRLRGGHTIVFHLQSRKASINLSQGLIKAKEYKTLRLSIYPYKTDLSTAGSEPLLQYTLEPRKPESVALSSLAPGTYMAVIDDARDGFSLSFTGDVVYGIMAGGRSKAWTFGRNNLVMEVRDVKSFTIQNEGAVTLRSPRGRVIDLQKQKGWTTVKLEEGEEGLWQLQRQSGKFAIRGVLPLLSADKEFLIKNEE